MTVAELIAALQEMPEDVLVVTPGFDEFGYSDLGRPRMVHIAHYPDAPAGLCEYRDPIVEPDREEPSFPAVLIDR